MPAILPEGKLVQGMQRALQQLALQLIASCPVLLCSAEMGNAQCRIVNQTDIHLNVKTYNYSDKSCVTPFKSYNVPPHSDKDVKAASDQRGLRVKITGDGHSRPLYKASNNEDIVIKKWP